MIQITTVAHHRNFEIRFDRMRETFMRYSLYNVFLHARRNLLKEIFEKIIYSSCKKNISLMYGCGKFPSITQQT